MQRAAEHPPNGGLDISPSGSGAATPIIGQGETLKISIPQQSTLGMAEKREKEKSVMSAVGIDQADSSLSVCRNVLLYNQTIPLRLRRSSPATRLLVCPPF